MTDPENLILEHLRAIRSDVALIKDDMRDVKTRLTSLETAVAELHGDFAGQSRRLDRLDFRLERVENRFHSRTPDTQASSHR